MQPNHGWYMGQALDEARKGLGRTSPNPAVGAVVVKGGEVVGRGYHRKAGTPHAEVHALADAGERAQGATLYVTLEPCPMCAMAASLARLRRIYYGAEDPKGGGIDHGPRILASTSCHHRPEVYGGIAASRSAELLRTFFQARR